jgi:hypothetical protein
VRDWSTAFIGETTVRRSVSKYFTSLSEMPAEYKHKLLHLFTLHTAHLDRVIRANLLKSASEDFQVVNSSTG